MKVTISAAMSQSTRRQCASTGSKASAKKAIEIASICTSISKTNYLPVGILCKKVTVKKEMTAFTDTYCRQMIGDKKFVLIMNLDFANWGRFKTDVRIVMKI